MEDFVRLNYKNSDRFVLIFPEDIPLIKHRKILGYYQYFREAISNTRVSSETITHWFWLLELIGQEINPEILWGEVIDNDLYFFFIANIAHDKDNNPIAKHSNLDLLLGFRDSSFIEDITEIPSEEEPLTTDDPILDTITVTLLNFKHGYQLLHNFSLSQLMKINKYAGELQEQARIEAEKEVKMDSKSRKPGIPKRSKVAKIKPLTTEQRSAIDKVANLGLSIPD